MKKGSKRALIILAFVVGLSYFAFTLVLFDPFEGSYMDSFEGKPVAIEYVVPRNVDFFAHKRSLENDFEVLEFPVPGAWDRVRLSKNWQRFARTTLHAELTRDLDLGSRIEQIRAATAEIPLLHPLVDLVGKDVAVFGRLKGRGFDETEVAGVFLASNMARFAYEVAGNSLLRSLFGLPIEVEEDSEGIRKVTLEGEDPLYLYRHKDLFVVCSGPLLIKEVAVLLDVGREQSLGWTRRYHQTVAQDVDQFAGIMASTEPTVFADIDRRLQLHFNLPTLFSLTEGDEEFLEDRGQVSRWILARLFNPRYFDDVTLDLGFGETLDLRSMIGFDKEDAEAAQIGFFNQKTFELRKTMDRVAALVPEQTWFLMAARIDPMTFLPKLVTGLTETDPKARELLDELIAAIRRHRPDFQAGDSMEAARHMASILGHDVVVAVVRDTYFGVPRSPLPLLAIFLQVTDRGPSFETLAQEAANGLPQTGYNGFIFPIMQAHGSLQQEGRGVAKWYKVWHEKQGSDQERYVQDVVLQGTEVGNVSFGIIDPRSKSKGPWTLAVVLSPQSREIEVQGPDGQPGMQLRGTANELLTDIIKLSKNEGAPKPADVVEVKDEYTGGTRPVSALLNSQKYIQDQEFLTGFASVALYLDADGWKQGLRDGALAHAESAAEIDWAKEAREIEEGLFAGEFASWKGKEMPDGVLARYERAVEKRKDAIEEDHRMNVVPALRREYEENLAWVDLIRSAFLAARIDETSGNIEVRAKIRTRLD
ncbi:MAG: hypothetical protein V2A76_05670 [Planctomycetota bacterium]